MNSCFALALACALLVERGEESSTQNAGCIILLVVKVMMKKKMNYLHMSRNGRPLTQSDLFLVREISSVRRSC